MIAYRGSEILKQERIDRIREHRRQEHLLQAYGYWHDGKGCAVGCTVEADDNPHRLYETEIGIPIGIAFLEDSIFEGLPKTEAMEWPERFLAAIPVGADLSKVPNYFCAWLLSPEPGLLTIDDTNREAIAAVAALHIRAASGESINGGQWLSAARSAASSVWPESAAAAASSLSAAASTAASSLWPELAAASTALSAARSAAAWSAAWLKIADKLVELLAAAPVL